MRNVARADNVVTREDGSEPKGATATNSGAKEAAAGDAEKALNG